MAIMAIPANEFNWLLPRSSWQPTGPGAPGGWPLSVEHRDAYRAAETLNITLMINLS